MNLEFECLQRNFEYCQTTAEIAFYMAIDLMNICGELARNFPYANKESQMDIAKSLGIQLVESVDNYRNGKVHVWTKEELESVTIDFSKLPPNWAEKEEKTE